jgi:cell division protein FtsW
VKAKVTLMLTVLALLIFGIVMIYSTSGPFAENKYGAGHGEYFIVRHAVWVALGLVACWVGAKVDYHAWMKGVWAFLGVTVVLLVLVYIPPVGKIINGSRRWVGVMGYTFQPSELAKFAIINLMAWWYGRRRREVPGYWHRVKWDLLAPGVVFGAVLALILFETDFGSTMLIGTTGALLMFVGGAPVAPLLVLVPVAAGGLGYMISQNSERMGRVVSFLHPEDYAQGEGYQLLNALYAFVEGGPWGVGLGQSLQKRLYLPEAHTDFIFAIVGEELGVVATLAVVAAFVVFFVCGMRISGRAADAGGRLMAFGITVLMSVQAIVNVAMVTGCAPTKGFPLPFISFGGSSLIVTLFMVGVLLNVADQGVAAGTGRRRR